MPRLCLVWRFCRVHLGEVHTRGKSAHCIRGPVLWEVCPFGEKALLGLYPEFTASLEDVWGGTGQLRGEGSRIASGDTAVALFIFSVFHCPSCAAA